MLSMPSVSFSQNSASPLPQSCAQQATFEAAWLHPLAAQSGHEALIRRARASQPCPIRTAFQQDRDRILHSKAFRRLKYKTQVFISPNGDHYRTRLTHTLEVAQIARTMARALRLNEDLTEAIALGHDLGHPPFGHSGEHALSALCKEAGLPEGFSHTLHSVRIATVLEPLNLTAAVLSGMQGQGKGNTDEALPVPLESKVVELADRMAYLRHDVEDAQRAELMSEGDIPAEIRQTLGEDRQERLNTLVLDLIETSAGNLNNGQAKIAVSPERFEAMQALRGWMFERIYLSPRQQVKDAQVKHLLEGLWQYYQANPKALPEDSVAPVEQVQAVLDYMAGMTDRFALSTYQTLLLPRPYL